MLQSLTADLSVMLLSLTADLSHSRLDTGEGGKGLLLEEGIQSLQDGLQTLKESQSRPHLTLTLTG